MKNEFGQTVPSATRKLYISKQPPHSIPFHQSKHRNEHHKRLSWAKNQRNTTKSSKVTLAQIDKGKGQ